MVKLIICLENSTSQVSISLDHIFKLSVQKNIQNPKIFLKSGAIYHLLLKITYVINFLSTD